MSVAPSNIHSNNRNNSRPADITDLTEKQGVSKVDTIGPDFKKYDWIKPNKKAAKHHRTSNLMLHGKYPICGDMKDPQLGTATILYFNFLKQLMFVFSILTLLSLPALYFASTGSKLEATGFSGGNALSITSLGNIGDDTNVTSDEGSVPIAPHNLLPYKVDAYILSYICTACVAVSVLFTLIYISRSISKLQHEMKAIYTDTVSVGDYAVFVRGLPPTATQREILEHFNNLYKLDGVSWSDRGWCCGLLARHRPRDPSEIVDRGYITSPRIRVSVPDDAGTSKQAASPKLKAAAAISPHSALSPPGSPKIIVKETYVRTPKKGNVLLTHWNDSDFKAAEALSPKRDPNFVEAKLIQSTQALSAVSDYSNTGEKLYLGESAAYGVYYILYSYITNDSMI